MLTISVITENNILSVSETLNKSHYPTTKNPDDRHHNKGHNADRDAAIRTDWVPTYVHNNEAARARKKKKENKAKHSKCTKRRSSAIYQMRRGLATNSIAVGFV